MGNARAFLLYISCHLVSREDVNMEEGSHYLNYPAVQEVKEMYVLQWKSNE